jgi:hypothetical protein
MVKDWINHYVDVTGEWRSGQPKHYKSNKIKEFKGSTVRIHETSVGGSVLLSCIDNRLTTYGMAEVYLKIFYTTGKWEYLSAPLTTSIDLKDVDKIELNILFPIGNQGSNKILYRALVNAHCVYEVLK